MSPPQSSASTEAASAMKLAMLEKSAEHARQRGEQFYTAIHEFSELAEDNKPLLTPTHVLIAEIVGNLSILMALHVMAAYQAPTTGNGRVAFYCLKVQALLVNAQKAVFNLFVAL